MTVRIIYHSYIAAFKCFVFILPHIKQLKAGMKAGKDQMDKATTIGAHDQVNIQDVSRTHLLVEEKTRKESYARCVTKEEYKLKKLPIVQTEIVSDQKNTEESNVPTKFYNNITGIRISPKDDQLTIVKIQLNKRLMEVTSTMSGDLAIELDEKIIDMIESKIKADPNICIFAKKTESGHFVLDFITDENALMSNQKITMKKTQSGQNFLELHKDFVNELKCHNMHHKNNNNLDLNLINAQDTIEVDAGISAVGHYDKNVAISQSNTSVDYLFKNIEDFIDLEHLCCLKDVAVRFMGRNGVSKDIKAPVTKTLSGKVAIDIKNILSFGEISFTDNEYPILVEKTSANKLLLDITKDNKPNATLRRKPSGGILLIAKKSVLFSANTKSKELRENKPFFKVKIKDIQNNIKEPPAVLHVTPSNNYVIVLDKEYEKIYLKTINDYIGEDNNECLVELHRTVSDTYIITLIARDDICVNSEQNALLVKSKSGYIKVLVNAPIFDAVDRDVLRKTSMSSAKAYEILLEKLPNSKKKCHVDMLIKSNLHYTKSSSDSYLYDTYKMNLSDPKILCGDPSATLKRTTSGHYAVILNKESKKAFVKSLKNYLKGSQGLIPIRRADSGEITIVLNNENESKVGYGSLKITPSGNIYVVVDEKVIEDLSKGSDTNKVDTGSKHVIGQIEKPVNKSVTTTCNALPDSCSCDSSKCVCNRLEVETQKWLQNSSIKSGLRLFHPKNCSVDWIKGKKNKDNGVCNPKKCQDTYVNNTQDGNFERSPHIVIKPCECDSMTATIEKKLKSNECHYMVEAICPVHKDRYVAMSNELLEISGLCNKIPETHIDNDTRQNQKEYEYNWDSLSFLPPQLPAFLNSYKYR